MKEDRSKGIDGHNPSDERRSQLEKALLKYNVDSLSQLPINFSILLLQADGKYGNKVWDKHFGHVYSQLKTKRNYHSEATKCIASLQSLISVMWYRFNSSFRFFKAAILKIFY